MEEKKDIKIEESNDQMKLKWEKPALESLNKTKTENGTFAKGTPEDATYDS